MRWPLTHGCREFLAPRVLCDLLMSPSVAVLDYGSGNLHSAQRALERAGAVVTVTADRDTVLAADGLVVPGVQSRVAS